MSDLIAVEWFDEKKNARVVCVLDVGMRRPKLVDTFEFESIWEGEERERAFVEAVVGRRVRSVHVIELSKREE